MRSARFLAAAAAMMAAVPAMAAPVATAAQTSATANPAASLSLGNVSRTGAQTQRDSDVFGFPLFFVFLVVAASGLGIAAAAGAFSSSK